MAKKNFIILLCFILFLTWTVAPDAFARERRGGSDVDLTPYLIGLGVVAIVSILFMLGSSVKSSPPQKEVPKVREKTEIMDKQNSSEQGNIEDVTSLSFKF